MTLKLPYQGKDSGLVTHEDHKEEEGRGRGGEGDGRKCSFIEGGGEGGREE